MHKFMWPLFLEAFFLDISTDILPVALCSITYSDNLLSEQVSFVDPRQIYFLIIFLFVCYATCQFGIFCATHKCDSQQGATNVSPVVF